mgnify:CR=1 FL=1
MAGIEKRVLIPEVLPAPGFPRESQRWTAEDEANLRAQMAAPGFNILECVEER